MTVDHFTDLILKFRVLILIVTLLIVVVCSLGLAKIHVTSDYRIMFSEDFPQLLAFDKMQETFGQRDNIMIVLAPEDGDIFTNKTLDAIEQLTRAAWQTPFSR
ncbi:MAG: hypothetical protein KUG71_10045, partial [Porticoccaceae bacterium]|nr:hypothetical protein [Porticoccaceae bacterium]